MQACTQSARCGLPCPPALRCLCHTLPRREGLHRLTQLIFSKALPKRLGAQILSGPMLAGLTEAYVTAINNGWVPLWGCRVEGMREERSGAWGVQWDSRAAS